MSYHITQERWPDGFIIGRQLNPPFWEFWNPGDKWAGSGWVFPSAAQAARVVDHLVRKDLAEAIAKLEATV